MAIDIASDIAAVLGTTADFTRTAATWTKSDGTTSDSVTGILIERDAESLDDSSLDSLSAIFMVANTEFTNVTIRSPRDTVTVSGQAAWTVLVVRQRANHVFVRMIKDTQRGRSA